MNLTPFLTVYARGARAHIYGLKENQLHIYMADKMDEPVAKPSHLPKGTNRHSPIGELSQRGLRRLDIGHRLPSRVLPKATNVGNSRPALALVHEFLVKLTDPRPT